MLTVVAFTASAIGGALPGTAGPAHADVTSGGYAVVGPAGSAGSVVASARESASTDFVVTSPALLAGAKDHAINATEKLSVDGGKTVAITVTLVGPALG